MAPCSDLDGVRARECKGERGFSLAFRRLVKRALVCYNSPCDCCADAGFGMKSCCGMAKILPGSISGNLCNEFAIIGIRAKTRLRRNKLSSGGGGFG